MIVSRSRSIADSVLGFEASITTESALPTSFNLTVSEPSSAGLSSTSSSRAPTTFALDAVLTGVALAWLEAASGCSSEAVASATTSGIRESETPVNDIALPTPLSPPESTTVLSPPPSASRDAISAIDADACSVAGGREFVGAPLTALDEFAPVNCDGKARPRWDAACETRSPIAAAVVEKASISDPAGPRAGMLADRAAF